MYFQKASDADLQGILDLQRKNFVHNLTDNEKKQGFLSIEFTKDQFKTMNDETGIIVCKNSGTIYGYLCTSSLKFNRSFELPCTMMNLYPQLHYKGKALDKYCSVVAGPWCIEKNLRGKNIFINMWAALGLVLGKNIDLITTFVSIHNLRSYYAAQKVGMEEIATFKVNSNEFFLLAKTHVHGEI